MRSAHSAPPGGHNDGESDFESCNGDQTDSDYYEFADDKQDNIKLTNTWTTVPARTTTHVINCRKLSVIMSQKYKVEYGTEFNYTASSPKGQYYAMCTLCNRNFSIKHSGRYDIKTHQNSQTHKELIKVKQSTRDMTQLFGGSGLYFQFIDY